MCRGDSALSVDTYVYTSSPSSSNYSDSKSVIFLTQKNQKRARCLSHRLVSYIASCKRFYAFSTFPHQKYYSMPYLPIMLSSVISDMYSYILGHLFVSKKYLAKLMVMSMRVVADLAGHQIGRAHV